MLSLGGSTSRLPATLGTVEKTIKVHRGRMMEKLGVRTVADLVRMAGKAGISAVGGEAVCWPIGQLDERQRQPQ